MPSIQHDTSLKFFTKSANFKEVDSKETALDSLRRYNVYSQMLESYKYVTCHPKMATMMITFGVCLHVPSVIYYSCYYFSYLVYVYCTVVPNLMVLFNFRANINLKDFRPPWNIFTYCVTNLTTCYLGLLCIILTFYLLLPIKGKYLAAVEKQHKRRKRYCVMLFALLTLYLPYQIMVSLHRNISMIQLAQTINSQNKSESFHQTEGGEAIQLLMLSDVDLTNKLYEQGSHYFWTLHAYEYLHCCCTRDQNTSEISANLPIECSQTYPHSMQRSKMYQHQTHKDNLWPHCSRIVLNIASDTEITMDTQMQVSLLISCVVFFVLKYSLQPHLMMQCDNCKPTFGWMGMKRPDN